jgi:hypothetical protein
MSHTDAGTVGRPYKWYHNRKFPLLPLLEVREGDEHNTSSFTFRWLFITMWSLDSVSFEVTVTISTHWGVGLIGILPYLRWAAAVPFPDKVELWVYKYTHRFSRKAKEQAKKNNRFYD